MRIEVEYHGITPSETINFFSGDFQRALKNKHSNSISCVSANMWDLKVKRLHPLAQLPTMATSGSAGYDLYALTTTEIPPFDLAKIRTGIAIELPVGHYGQICSRSSLTIRKMSTLGGVIDNDYRGEIFVTIMNHSNAPVKLIARTRVGQIICIPFACLDIMEVNELSKTERGNKGFGSSES